MDDCEFNAAWINNGIYNNFTSVGIKDSASKLQLEITDDGKWNAKFSAEFKQPPSDPNQYDSNGPRHPFYAQDYSRAQSNTVKRARRLAKPTWSDEEGRSGQDFMDLLNEEELLNKTIDFSFDLKWKGTGDWSNYKDYAIDVSDKSRDVLPEKELMHTIPIGSITRKISKPTKPV